MSCRDLVAVVATLLLCNQGTLAAEKEVSLRWSELQPALAAREVRIVLANGPRVEGKVSVVEPAALRIHIRKSSDKKVQPKGDASIPRTAVSVLQLVRYRKAWRIASTVTASGLVAGIAGGAAYGVAISGSGQDFHAYYLFGAAAAVGICVGAYYLGKRADRRITTIRIVPEP